MQAKWGLIAVIALVIAMMFVTVALSGCPKAEAPNPDEGMILPDNAPPVDPDVTPDADVTPAPADDGAAPAEGTDAGMAPVDDGAAPEGTDMPAAPEGEEVPPPAG